jgi:hypothetical protein
MGGYHRKSGNPVALDRQKTAKAFYLLGVKGHNAALTI